MNIFKLDGIVFAFLYGFNNYLPIKMVQILDKKKIGHPIKMTYSKRKNSKQ